MANVKKDTAKNGMNKLKIGIIGGAAVAILVFITSHFRAAMRERDAALVKQADRIAQLESENERLSELILNAKSSDLQSRANGVSGLGVRTPQSNEPSRELLRLRAEVGVLRRQANELVGVRKENISLSQAVAEAETNRMPAEDQIMMRQTHAVNAMMTLLQAIKNYAAAHNGQFPANLDQIIASRDLGSTNLAGNLRLDDFVFGQDDGTDPGGQPAILKLRTPIGKPGGGAVMIVGGIDDAGVPHTSVWNVP